MHNVGPTRPQIKHMRDKLSYLYYQMGSVIDRLYSRATGVAHQA